MKKHYLLTLLLPAAFFLQLNAQSLDLRLLQNINGPVSGADNAWRDVSKSIYITGSIVPAGMLITGLASHNKELTIQAFEVGGAEFIAAGLSIVIKPVVQRDRPYVTYPTLITGKDADGGYSFPSIHTSVAFAEATSLSLAFPKWYVIAPAFTYATAVGYSRLYLGVHYPSDIAAGALLGAGSSFLTWKLQKLLNKKYHYH